MLLLALYSIAVGFLIGAAGVGGVLLIPALMFFGDLETHQAMATALGSFFFVGVCSTWLFQRHGSFQWGITLPFLAGSLISGYAGAYAGAQVSARPLNMLLAAIIMLSSLYSLFPPRGTSLASRLGKKGNAALLFGTGMLTGFLCGMTGAGGGILSTPLMFLCGYATLPVIATAQILQSAVSLSGSASNLENGFIVFSIMWWTTAFEIVGVALGVRIAHKLSLEALKKATAILCILISLVIAQKAVFPL
ncbi:MAG: sulfite exporter TauE/SafE family protein [Desulfovibrio sp.]|jgi:uncharacterized membrane protein YfcA|nr:sulfite exporter TauE/SafE family protein [Desulfovibrio sp.]